MARSDNTRVALTASRRYLLSKLELIKKQDNEIKKAEETASRRLLSTLYYYRLLPFTLCYYHLLSITIIYYCYLLLVLSTTIYYHRLPLTAIDCH